MNGNKVSEASRITLYGSLVNILLSAGKLAAGIVYHSQALVADGLHSFSDLATDVMVLVGVRYWSAPPDKNHPYGHAKIEAIVTAVIGLLLERRHKPLERNEQRNGSARAVRGARVHRAQGTAVSMDQTLRKEDRLDGSDRERMASQIGRAQLHSGGGIHLRNLFLPLARVP